MTATPPDDVPIVVVHGASEAEAAAHYARTVDRPLVILFSPALALAGGPQLALAMRPETEGASIMCALDCADDPGAARRALLAGWSSVVIGDLGKDLMGPLRVLAKQRDAALWPASTLISERRPVVNLEGEKDPAHALQKALG